MNSVEEVLQRNDLVYDVLPPRWVFGLPIGNGEVGGMVWVRDSTQLIITLDHVWAWDNRSHPIKDPDRFNYQSFRAAIEAHDKSFLDIIPFHHHWHLPAKTHVGRVVIDFGQRISGTARLELISAEVRTSLQTESGDVVSISVLALADRPVIAIDHGPLTDIKDMRIERISSAKLRPDAPEWAKLPEHISGKKGSVEWIRQDISQDSSIALGLLPGETRSHVTVQVGAMQSDLLDDAVAVLKEVTADDNRFRDRHRIWWRDFWIRSAVQLPDPHFESLWYMGLYLLAASSRGGGTPVSLHGLWQPDGREPPQQGFFIFDFYPQYWGIHTANQQQLGTVYTDYFLSRMPHFKKQAKEFFGWDGLCIPGFIGGDGTWLVTDSRVFLWPGTTAWVAQHFWWHYLYGGDEEFLREKAYPFLRECMLFYEGLLEKGTDRRYHVPLTNSPEWGNPLSPEIWGTDDTMGLSCIRFVVSALLEAVDILGTDEAHIDLWKDIADNLAPYPVDDQKIFKEGVPGSETRSNGLALMGDFSYTHSHRHLSHLAPIYPCGDLNLDGSPEEISLIHQCMENLVAKGYWEWAGWSFVWASCVAARAGWREMAHWTLAQFADKFASCNTFNMNTDWKISGVSTHRNAISYCQDGNMAAVAAVNEMLLQSWGGRIRVFPSCPSHWRTVRFDKLLAEGGIEVSAVRLEGRTLGVRLASKTVTRVKLRNPFGDAGGFIGDQLIAPNTQDDLILDLNAVEDLWITATQGTSLTALAEVSVQRPESQRNPYGLKHLTAELSSDCFNDLEESRT